MPNYALQTPPREANAKPPGPTIIAKSNATKIKMEDNQKNQDGRQPKKVKMEYYLNNLNQRKLR